MNLPKPARTIFLFFAIIISVNDISAQNSKGVNQSWQEFYVYHEFGKKWEAGILFNLLTHFDHGLYEWFAEGKISYSITHWLATEVLYRQDYYKINIDSIKWTHEQRPMFRIVTGFNAGNFKFRQRNRIELRMFEFFNTKWRLRSDTRIKYATNFTSFNLTPYVTEEIFFTKRGLSRNRMYLGITGSKGLFTPSVYMLMQSDKIKEQWISRWILGVEIGIRI